MAKPQDGSLSNPETYAAHGQDAGSGHVSSAHVDTFAREHLPPKALWPVIKTIGIEDFAYPPSLNAAVELLDRNATAEAGPKPCLRTDHGTWSYQQLLDRANRVANLLVSNGLAPGERVLLRDVNSL